MSQITERKEAFAKFIQASHMYYINQVLGKPASQAEYAVWLGISPNTLTRLINAQSLPNLDNLIPIAEKLGPEAYDLCGIPRLAYTDPEFRVVMSYWHTLSDEKKRKVVENIKAMQRDEQGIPNGHAVTA